MHRAIEPAIFYLGTPVVLISTLNEDGSSNIAPMSSAWWLGWSCMLGLDASSKTTENLRRTGECVLNLPSEDLVGAVDSLAMLTGSRSVPLHKRMLGYRHCADKFSASGFTARPSELVGAPRIAECPVQLEAKVVHEAALGQKDPRMSVPVCAIELVIVKAHVDERLLVEPEGHRIDPDKWRPLIMSFRRFYGLGAELHPSQLARGPETMYAPWRGDVLTRTAIRFYKRWAERRYAGTTSHAPNA